MRSPVVYQARLPRYERYNRHTGEGRCPDESAADRSMDSGLRQDDESETDTQLLYGIAAASVASTPPIKGWAQVMQQYTPSAEAPIQTFPPRCNEYPGAGTSREDVNLFSGGCLRCEGAALWKGRERTACCRRPNKPDHPRRTAVSNFSSSFFSCSSTTVTVEMLRHILRSSAVHHYRMMEEWL